MNNPDQYDVAIIGYGPVGVTAANLLGAEGLSVLVVERDHDVYARARAISTDEEILRIWQRVGLAERLSSDMLGERPVEFVGVDGRPFVRTVVEPHGLGHPPQLFIYQPAVEQVLREGVDRYPNVEVRLGRECVRQAQDADGVELALLDLISDTVDRVRASYVIAADGGSSPTRGQLGISFEGRTYEDRWIVIDTKVNETWPEVDFLRFHCNPSRPAVDCPTPLGHHRWEFPVLPGDDETYLTSPEGVRALLRGQGIGDDQVEVLRAVVYSHHVRFAAKWRVGRVFLAGDAAHVMPPWIGQGMAAGVRDVANLSWKLAGVLRGELPDSVLDSYEIERQPHVRRVTSTAVRVGRFITERRPWLARLRDPMVRGLLALPVAGDAFVRSSWTPYPRYLDGFTASAPSRHGLRHQLDGADGWQVPQPWVQDSHGRRARLDDATGPGWVVLRRGDVAQHPTLDAWVKAGVPVIDVRRPGSAAGTDAVVDVDGTLLAWLAEQGVAAVAVRPDGFVHSSSAGGRDLPPPPFLTETVTRRPASAQVLA